MFDTKLNKNTIKKLENLNNLYLIFLESFKELEDKLHLSKTFSKAMLFQYMINNDLFISDNMILEDEIESIHPFNNKDLWQYQIFTGRNICRHDSKALNDILEYTNDVSLLIYGISKIDVNIFNSLSNDEKLLVKLLRKKLNNNEIEFPEFIEILNDLNIKYKPKYLYRRNLQNISIFPNHVINLIKDDNNLILVDTALDQIYKKVKNTYDFYRSNNYYHFLLEDVDSLFSNIFYSDDEEELFKDLFNKYEFSNYKDTILKKIILLRMFDNEKDIINEYTNNNQELYKEIRTKCLELVK